MRAFVISVLIFVCPMVVSAAPNKTSRKQVSSSIEANAAEAPSHKDVTPKRSPKPKFTTKKRINKKTLKRSKRRRAKKRKPKFPTKRPKNIDLTLPPLKSQTFEPGERLHFNVMMFGQHAGETILAVGEEEIKNGKRTLPLGGFLRGSPFLNKFYPIENSLHVWLEPGTFRPLFSDFVVDENRKRMKYITRYDHRRKKVSSLRYKGKKRLRRRHEPVADVYEPLGCIYAIRSMDLKVGDTFNYYLFDGRKERIVSVKVLAEEEVSVPAGLFRAKKISISTRITGGFVSKRMFDLPDRNGTIWIANDQWSTPLKMIAETKLGPAEAVLTKRYSEHGKIIFPEGA
jgi:hypothetical protein